MAHRDRAKTRLVEVAMGQGGASLLLTAPASVHPGLHRSGTDRLAEWLLSLTAVANYEEARFYVLPGGCIRTEASATGLALGVQEGVSIVTRSEPNTSATSQNKPALGGRYGAKVARAEGTGVRFDPLQGTPDDERLERLVTDLESACGLKWTGQGYGAAGPSKRALFVIDLAWLRDTGRCAMQEGPLRTLRQRWMTFLKQTRSADLIWIATGAGDDLRPLLHPGSGGESARRSPNWTVLYEGLLEGTQAFEVEADSAPWFPERRLQSVGEMLRTIAPKPPPKRASAEILRTIGNYQVERLAGSLDDVAGYDGIKRSIRTLARRWADPDLARSYGLTGNMGMLLFGPGGTGKTTIARAAAAELGLPFMEVKCSDFATKYINESASNLRAAFDAARSEPAIMLFFDEVDSILGQRDNSSGEDVKVINEFKAQLSKPLGNWRLVLVGATNNPWTMEAPVRQRFGDQLFIDLPDEAARSFLFRMKTPAKRLAAEVSLAELALQTEGYSGREIAAICQKASAEAFESIAAIDMTMFERAIAATPRTVTPREMQQHRNFATGAN
jgi:AAA+ superfamily predicted ATPase